METGVSSALPAFITVFFKTVFHGPGSFQKGSPGAETPGCSVVVPVNVDFGVEYDTMGLRLFIWPPRAVYFFL